MIKSGRVIRIFNDENLVINLGSNDGIEDGAKISIFAPPVEISDPETGDELGVYHHPKANVRAEHVSKKFCIAGPFPIKRQVKKPSGPATLFQQFQTEYRTEPGQLDIEEMDADPFPSGSSIRVGDPAYVTVADPPSDTGGQSGTESPSAPGQSPQATTTEEQAEAPKGSE